ncbi:MAG: glycosyltransferase family 4 protein [Actinomycetota bacterium]|nr:glycosyltransferase family 4 protein [Actinomycetota bacterium]
MKVGLVSPYDLGRPGGVQDQVIRLSGWLREAGHETVIVGPGTEGPDGARLLGATTVVPANRAATPIRLHPGVARDLTAALADVDVIHVHEPLMPAVSPAALRVEGSAKVATFHADPPGWVRRLYRHGRIGVRLAVRNAAVVTAVSPVAGSSIEGVVEYRIIPNGIDVSRYETGPKIPGRVVFLGRDDERKGLPVLLDAWSAVQAAVPDATLRVLGATRDEPISGVEFLGWVDDGVKEAELGAASVFCAPNLGGESFGIIVAEAMASGCAIVASSIPAFEHVAGPTARFVTPGHPDGLAQEIIELLTDFEKAAELGAAAAQRVRRFDGSSVAADYIVAYQDAIAGR